METKKENKAMSLSVTEGLTVTIIPSSDHEFLMTTKEVALGYEINVKTVRFHLLNNPDDFIEGKHYLKGAGISSPLGGNFQPHQVFYTKRGVVRLGFFIKSARAKLFRDWAEDLIVHQLDQYEENFAGVNLPPYQNNILYEFHSRVRTKEINDVVFYKIGDIRHLCKISQGPILMKKLPSLDNFVKITSDFWDIAEWWGNLEGVRQFLNTQKNRNMIRLHDALFSHQLSLTMGGN